MTALNQILDSRIGTTGSVIKAPPKSYRCEKCHDSGWLTVVKEGHEYARRCDCFKRRRAEKALQESGISEAFRNKTLENYVPKSEKQREALDKARKYVEIFGQYSMHMNFILLGQNGAGKTHLAVAMGNALIEKNVLVRFVTFQDLLDQLSKSRNQKKETYSVIDKYRDAELLIIDDIFRTTIREWNGSKNVMVSHVDAIFRILDYRYFNKKATLITGEKTVLEMMEMDRAITGRLVEKARGSIVEFKDPKLDHRFNGGR